MRRGDEVVAADLRAERLRRRTRARRGVVDDGPVDAAVVTAHGGLDDALQRLEPGGTLLVFARPRSAVPVSLDAVYRKELHGRRLALGDARATSAAAVELLPTLVLPPVTTLPLERFAEGVELYRSGDALKVVFTP